MRIDIFSIFPQYLDALNLSLIGKAREKGILDVRVKDLRDFATDKHRTVDDTPYGGGAGMVMKPEPWALALESTLESADSDSLSSFDKDSDMEEEGAPDPRPILLIPSPAGRVFDQALAYELSEEPHLLFACGRYEGIDERVFEWARQRFRVLPVSLGDYVLNGGEVAVLAMIEAIGRLIPGVVGNPMSLVEESHSDDLLEYPVYTKPSVWRGYETPEVLLGGHHGLIQEFRRREQLLRTADRRPDLLRGRSSGDLSKTEVKLLEELGYSRDENGVLNHSPEKIQ